MDEPQWFAIDGRVVGADDAQLHDALARAHESPARPRCLCVPGGVEMYVARYQHFVLKRMPQTGHHHHPGCPSYEPLPTESGLGELVGEAVIEAGPGRVELRVDFPWVRRAGHGVLRGETQEAAEVACTNRRMSLRALMHFLFEQAGFNRWSPAMAGKRNQAVIQKYLMEAAEGVIVKGERLDARLYVPEPFNQSRKVEAAQRRRAKLAILRPHEGLCPLAVVLGEFKACEAGAVGKRIWIRHMPDAPLLVGGRNWQRIERRFAPLFEASDADTGAGVRLLMAALIRARREQTYEVESASLMLASEHWIPLEGVHELPLVQTLVSQQRRFVKPLRYDAASVAVFANVLLLDAGPAPVPLHVLSPFMKTTERAAKERAFAKAAAAGPWVWNTDQPLPPLPAAVHGDAPRMVSAA